MMKDHINIRRFIDQLFDQETFVEIDAEVSPRHLEFNMAERDLTGDGVVTPEHPLFRGHPTDIGHPGSMCRCSILFSCPDRFYHPGAKKGVAIHYRS